ncbi:hypothetical protein AYO38_05435 [bacterium SCGC AG-212-C10]|nr:hypothetical protein AYO38_05435 [bacterium SCGC AG-212-C10]
MKDKKVLGGGAVLFVALFWFFIKPNYLDAKVVVPPTEAEIAAAPRPTLVIDQSITAEGHESGGAHEGLVLNLKAPTSAPSYAKVVIVLEFADPEHHYVGLNAAAVSAKNVAFAEELKPQVHRILDTVTTVFAARTIDQVATNEGKAKLKEELMEAINEELHHEKVEDIYFETFVTQ